MSDKSIFLRLKEERVRLALTQRQAATLCGVQAETWSRYESGKLSPGSEVLAALASAGADVQYILIGVRGAVLAVDEQLMVDRYRLSTQPLRDAALRVLLGGSEITGAKQVFQGDVGSAHEGGSVFNQPVSITVGGNKKKT